jgi:hypothetical protein
MNRRQFLTRALASIPVVALAPTVIAELLEELAPARTIMLPPAEGWPELTSLEEIARRAFLPKLIKQLYETSPLMRQMMLNVPLHREFEHQPIRAFAVAFER